MGNDLEKSTLKGDLYDIRRQLDAVTRERDEAILERDALSVTMNRWKSERDEALALAEARQAAFDKLLEIDWNDLRQQEDAAQRRRQISKERDEALARVKELEAAISGVIRAYAALPKGTEYIGNWNAVEIDFWASVRALKILLKETAHD